MTAIDVHFTASATLLPVISTSYRASSQIHLTPVTMRS